MLLDQRRRWSQDINQSLCPRPSGLVTHALQNGDRCSVSGWVRLISRSDVQPGDVCAVGQRQRDAWRAGNLCCSAPVAG